MKYKVTQLLNNDQTGPTCVLFAADSHLPNIVNRMLDNKTILYFQEKCHLIITN